MDLQIHMEDLKGCVLPYIFVSVLQILQDTSGDFVHLNVEAHYNLDSPRCNFLKKILVECVVHTSKTGLH